MQPTHNTLTEKIRAQSIDLLNRHLSAAIDLNAQIKQAFWNVRGPGFISVRQLFENIIPDVDYYSDRIAERTGSLGGIARGTVRTAAECSFLPPYPLNIADEPQHIDAVAGALAMFGKSARESVDQASGFGDTATADLFTEVSRSMDRQLWLVESHKAPTENDKGPDQEDPALVRA